MKKTIRIPKGYQIKYVDHSTGEVECELIPKDVMNTIKSFDDVLIHSKLSKADFQTQCVGLEIDEIAYKKLKLICKTLNEGWVPDWTNGNWDKYYPWFKMGSPSGAGFSYNDYAYWSSGSTVGSRLCFKSSELAEYAGKTFENIYKEFLT